MSCFSYLPISKLLLPLPQLLPTYLATPIRWLYLLPVTCYLLPKNVSHSLHSKALYVRQKFTERYQHYQ